MRLNWGLRLLFLVLALAASAVQATELRDLKVLAVDGSTRAVLALSGPAKYRMFTLENPRRLVLDLDATETAGQFRLPGANGAVASVRTGRPSPHVLRVVFDLGKAVSPEAVIATAGSGSRLTISMVTGDSPVTTSRPLVAEAMPVAVSSDDSRSAAYVSRSSPLDRVASPTAIASATNAQPISQPISDDSRKGDDSVDSDDDSGRAPSDVADQAATTAALPSHIAPTRTLQDVIGTGQRKLVVAIDAGHGGKDPGAHGPSGVHEKDVTLAVARELAAQINADPGMKAVLIRDSDSFVPLQDRYMKARAAQADLFISIHADASPNQTATGASVFVLSTRGASSQAARWLADSENAADLVGGVSLDDKDRNLSAVLLDLSQSATMRASDDVAEQVLDALKNVGKAHHRDIERANFVVLRSPDVPSMLVETGFITNPGEEQKLDDPNYRDRLAAAIASGVRQYFTVQAPPGSLYASRQNPTQLLQDHVVGRGETLSMIAARHGVALETLRAANNKRDDSVQVGEHLRIPAPSLALVPK
jgi:N-acetylmuramoyl-L-alanine amidase